MICAFSGFGLDGPDASLPGYDLIAQARSGLMSVTGVDGVPQRVSTALSDVAAGTVAAFAIAAALVRQQRTGEGEIVDVALLEADLALMSPRIASFLAGEPEPKPCAGADSVVAIYQSMRTADRTIVVALGNDNHWQRACAALGLDHLAQREELSTNAGRRAHRQRGRRRDPGEAGGDAVRARLEAALRRRCAVCRPSTSCPRSSPTRRSWRVAPSSTTSTRSPGSSAESALRGDLASDPEDRQARMPAPLRGEHGREVLAGDRSGRPSGRRAGGRGRSYGFRDRDLARRSRARRSSSPVRTSSTH